MGGNGQYYVRLAREDYYLNGGEPMGRWWGKGAEQVYGLGTVSKKDFRWLMKGFGPDGNALVQNAGKKDRQVGWDLTFSAPKSFSILWGMCDEHTRKILDRIFDDAVRASLEYVQEEVGFTRRGKAGGIIERAGLIVSIFDHGTNRLGEPQRHAHALVSNSCVREDLTTGTLLSKPIYQAKMTAGALFRAQLAEGLSRELGVRCVREEKNSSFYIEGIDKALCDDQSTRRAEIKAHLKSFGSETASAAAIATYETRRTKVDTPPRIELFKRWAEIGERFGFDQAKVLGQFATKRHLSERFSAALNDALHDITKSESHFTEQQLLKTVAVNAQDKQLSARDIRLRVKHEVEHLPEIISLGIYDGRMRYTTASVMKLEKSLIEAVDGIAGNLKHGVGERKIEKGLNEFGRHLTDEQRNAVRMLTEKGGGLRSLEGIAGTGKTSTLGVAREIWEAKGYNVIGTTLSAKAAGELREGAAIPSRTLASLDYIMRKPSAGDVLAHELKQLARAFLMKDRYNQTKPFKFDKNTVLVVDESAMVETRDLAKLAVALEKAGGMLVSVFDRKQLQAIGPGGGAAFVADRHQQAKATLTEIVRQHEEWMRDMVRQFERGDAAGALKQLELAGRLHVGKDRGEAIATLVSDWTKNEEGKRDRSLIFVGTREEATEINRRCQKARHEGGELGQSHLRMDEREVYEGDRVIFRQNSKKLGVINGWLGTIVGFVPDTSIAVVKLDTGGLVNIPLSKYKEMHLGYAVTTHSGQGTTIDNSYLLAGGKMQDLHLSYVQASRARETVRLYTDRNEAGDKLSELAKQMSKEREKTLAHEMAQRAQEEERKRKAVNDGIGV